MRDTATGRHGDRPALSPCLPVAPSSAPHGCHVELLGPARLLAGIKEIAVSLDCERTVREFVPALAECCPALVGPVLDLERRALVDGYVLNRNGRDFLADADAIVRPGDRLLLLSSAAGG